MNHDKIKTLVTAILENLGDCKADVMKLGVTGIQVVSERTVRIDIADGKSSTGVNRIKVTLQENGELRVRTGKFEELEDVPNIAPVNLLEALKNIAGIEA
jgi:hypothetical protein